MPLNRETKSGLIFTDWYHKKSIFFVVLILLIKSCFFFLLDLSIIICLAIFHPILKIPTLPYKNLFPVSLMTFSNSRKGKKKKGKGKEKEKKTPKTQEDGCFYYGLITSSCFFPKY